VNCRLPSQEALQRLEPYAGKLARTVLRGGQGSNALSLPGEKEYRAFMRKAWKLDPGVRQHVIAVGRMLARNQKVEFRGRFADIARRIAERSR